MEVRNRCSANTSAKSPPRFERLDQDLVHRLYVQDVAQLLADAHDGGLGPARADPRRATRLPRREWLRRGARCSSESPAGRWVFGSHPVSVAESGPGCKRAVSMLRVTGTMERIRNKIFSVEEANELIPYPGAHAHRRWSPWAATSRSAAGRSRSLPPSRAPARARQPRTSGPFARRRSRTASEPGAIPRHPHRSFPPRMHPPRSRAGPRRLLHDGPRPGRLPLLEARRAAHRALAPDR